MNELTQERIAEQFVKLADESGLMGKVIAKRLGIPVLYITYIRIQSTLIPYQRLPGRHSGNML